MNIAIFCSGNGTNFQAIAEAVKKGEIKAKLALMVCDNPQAFALERAKKLGVSAYLIERDRFKSKKEYEQEIIQRLETEKIDLICLAGYMRIVGKEILQKYKNRILNIHPALLPSFKGTQAIKDALDYGAKVTGVTVHFVDEEMDHGPIILQRGVEISPGESEETLAEKIHTLEHQLYPLAVKLFVEGKLKPEGRKVIVT
jgi:phosphoribosylglycinamide formyltransferase-1